MTTMAQKLLATLPRPLANIVAPYSPHLVSVATAFGSANLAVACRVRVTAPGVLRDLVVAQGASSGNIDVGIYDTTATTRKKLWSTGSIACPTANQWSIVGDPALPVAAGDELDFVVAADNTTAAFAHCAAMWASAASALPAGYWPSVLGGSNRAYWSRTTSFPLPTTAAEAGLSTASSAPFVMARLAPA